MTSPPKNTLSNSKAKITRAVQTSSGFLKKPTLPEDTDSDPTLELYSHLRPLDIYFTNPAGTNVLGIGSDALDVPTASQIAARTDLWMFVDFLDTTKITTPTAGTLTEVIAVNDSEFDFDTTNGTAVVYEDFGSNSGKCVRFNN